jgi:hypothetical protein
MRTWHHILAVRVHSLRLLAEGAHGRSQQRQYRPTVDTPVCLVGRASDVEHVHDRGKEIARQHHLPRDPPSVALYDSRPRYDGWDAMPSFPDVAFAPPEWIRNACTCHNINTSTQNQPRSDCTGSLVLGTARSICPFFICPFSMPVFYAYLPTWARPVVVLRASSLGLAVLFWPIVGGQPCQSTRAVDVRKRVKGTIEG